MNLLSFVYFSLCQHTTAVLFRRNIYKCRADSVKKMRSIESPKKSYHAKILVIQKTYARELMIYKSCKKERMKMKNFI